MRISDWRFLMSEPWLERWAEGRIGWHERDGNRSLREFWPRNGRRVLVPLCGKSKDLVWLEAQGNEILGIELSELAARAFFEENDLKFRQTDGGRRYEAVGRNIAIVVGDYFDFHGETFDAHYDRGALVALPEDLRSRYAAHTDTLLLPQSIQLIVTLEYEQALVDGPPFSVTRDEILSYWPALERIDVHDDIENAPPKFRAAQISKLLEVIWRYG